MKRHETWRPLAGCFTMGAGLRRRREATEFGGMVSRGKTWARCAVSGLAAAAFLIALLWAPVASAQEIALTVGKFLGDDVLDSVPIVSPTSKVDFADSNIYGLRVSTGTILADVEFSLLTAGTSLLKDTALNTGARFTYLEGGATLKIFPGPFAPFLAGGIGLHRLTFDIPGADSYTKVGYYVGAGVKIGLGGVGFRADLRDHITPIKLAGIDPGVAALIGLDKDTTAHNFELSVGLVIPF